jgi:diacylglycerol kinase family enzyme
MLVVVNPSADNGRAQTHWERLRPELAKRIGAFTECLTPTRDRQAVRAEIRAALGRGETRFVAVGGDGTVNLVIHSLAELAPPDLLARCTLGAVGMGSSNDFHKPARPDAIIGGYPCRLDFARPIRHDIGRTTYYDDAKRQHVTHWIINASVGMTAHGNWLYNEARGLIGLAKRLSAAIGMTAAALRALFAAPRQPMTLQRDDGPPVPVRIRNLGVVKNPHFTGWLRYDSPYEPGSGNFFIHVLANSSLWDTLITLARLARGRFAGRRTAQSWRGRQLAVECSTPFAVEGDGEIVVTRRADFSLQPRAIQVCR